MLQELSFVFLYISFFGLSDLLVQYLALKSYFQKIIYYLVLLSISILLYYSFHPLLNISFIVSS